jgi:Zn-finger nucleic acid-binding protein
MVHCPNCRTISLTPTTLKNIVCLRCPSCKGALFTDTSLRMQADGRLLDVIEEGADTRSIVSPLECQECHRKMQRLIFPATPTHCAVLDKCSYCARFWVQRSEVTEHLHEKAQEPYQVDWLTHFADIHRRNMIYGSPYGTWQTTELTLWLDILSLLLR